MAELYYAGSPAGTDSLREKTSSLAAREEITMTKDLDRSSQSTLNMDELLTRVENDRDLLRELIDLFKQELPRILQHLRSSIAGGDIQNVEVASHTLKGMLSGLSAMRAAATVSQLEAMARAGKTTDMPAGLKLLEKEITELLPELDACTAEAKA